MRRKKDMIRSMRLGRKKRRKDFKNLKMILTRSKRAARRSGTSFTKNHRLIGSRNS